MKFALAAALLVAAPALAQPAPAPVKPPVPVTAPMAPATVAKFDLDTPVETLAADAQAKAVLTADLPKLLPHPSYEMFKGMSLRQLMPYSQGEITDDLLKKVEADLAAIK